MKKEHYILTAFSILFVIGLIACNAFLQNTPAAIVNNNISLIAKNYQDPSDFYTDDFLVKIYGEELVHNTLKSTNITEAKNILFMDFMKALTAKSYGFPYVTKDEGYSIRFLFPSLPNYYISLIQIDNGHHLVFDDVEGEISAILDSINGEDKP